MNISFFLKWAPIPFLVGMIGAALATGNITLSVLGTLALAVYVAALGGLITLSTFSDAAPYVFRAAHATAQGLEHLGKKGVELANLGFEGYKLKPWLWTGVLLVLFAIWVFLDSYSEKDWFMFHKSGAILLIATGCFVTHFDQWGTIAQAVFGNLLRSWAIASAIVLVIASGHIYIEAGMMAKHQTNLSTLEVLKKSYDGDTGWWYMTGVSILSLVAAIITLMKGWPALARWTGEVFAFIGGFFINKHGPLMTTVSWGVLMAILTIGAFGRNQESSGDWAGELYVLYSAFIFVILIGLGVVIVNRIKK